jgi:hypothetical protein
MQSISLAVSVVAAQQAAKFVGNSLSLASAKSWLPSVVALLIAGCSLYVMQFLLERAFESMEWLRHLLLGPQFIEGQWYIIFRIEDKPVAFGVTRITSTEEGIRFQGEDFQCEGVGRGHYKTDIAILDWPTIKYKYHYHQSAAEQHSSQGYGEAQFFEGDHKTQKFSGIFFELLGQRVTYFEGWRVSKKDRKALAKLEKPEERKKMVEAFFAELFPGTADDSKPRYRTEKGAFPDQAAKP